MALLDVSCTRCGKLYSPDRRWCPHCGGRGSEQTASTILLGFATLLGVISLFTTRFFHAAHEAIGMDGPVHFRIPLIVLGIGIVIYFITLKKASGIPAFLVLVVALLFGLNACVDELRFHGGAGFDISRDARPVPR